CSRLRRAGAVGVRRRAGKTLMRIGAIIATAICAGGAAEAAGLPRAASLDFCADQYLLALADRSQIAAVSPGADEEDSYLRASARGLRVARPTTEEIATVKPDVVFRFWGGAPGMTEALSRFGAQVITLDYPSDFDIVRKDIRVAAAALGREEAGERLIAELDGRLHRLAQRPRSDVAALYLTPGGVTAGSGTMIHAIIEAAGLTNAAADRAGWPPLPMETIAFEPPAFIVAGFFEAATEYVNHWSASRHPVFAKTLAETPTVRLRAELISCPAWFAIEAAEEIAERAQAINKSRPDAE
ncbi:MAG: ABC transporter substrate-binding protein, partial [Parvularculaceae bacterium]